MIKEMFVPNLLTEEVGMLNGDMVSLYCYSLSYHIAILNLEIVGPLIVIDERGVLSQNRGD